jgi:hypothetical protein
MSIQNIGTSPRRRVGTAIGGLLLAGLIGTGCGAAAGNGPAASGSARHFAPVAGSSAKASATTTTTTPALPACGSLRDPFDPTLTPPPAGSVALCSTPTP